MKRYEPKQLEPKWQKIWEETKLYKSEEDSNQEKKYVLDFFPYPSGAGLSVGHVRNYTISDTYPRFKRMQGYNVLHPMGWDAFGLPAENYAIKNKLSPREATDQNKANYKRQMDLVGFSYDWDREIDSTHPDYYRWTQWFFLLLHKRGLAYQAESEQWWCPVDKTVLANEQVENGKCWRCGNEVTKKALKQWFFKITEYADRLLEGLDDIDWPDNIKTMQRNWIGKSIGAEITFAVEKHKTPIRVFTTRADTIFSAAYMVLAPEHELVDKITTKEQQTEVQTYVKQALRKSDIDRMEETKEKTGVFTGAHAINPANGEKLPIWVADFVIGGYGTGAIFGDIHDERDFEFAKKYQIPARVTVIPEEKKEAEKVKHQEYPYTGEGVLIDSGKFTGMKTSTARGQIIAWLSNNQTAKEQVNYRLRDWLISRQRYWGAPIPIIHCPKDGAVPVPEKDLPVHLPEVKSYEPSGDGKSPLANVPNFVNTICPKCGSPAERETDTMDGFACSSWYFLRFADPHNKKTAFSKDKIKYWLPVDMYIGGAEHAVMHLLYARFWTKVMQDEGLIDFGEPFKTLRNQGLILADDGRKMSKSLNNVITPDEVIDKGYGADALRVFELFIAPYDQSVPWNEAGLAGTFRFLSRTWVLFQEFLEQKAGSSQTDNVAEAETALTTVLQKAARKVTGDLEKFAFNTAVAALMELLNELYKLKVELPFAASSKVWQSNLETLLKLLAPFAPHITEELWQELGHETSIHVQDWPTWDEQLIKEELVTIVVQVNGKVRANITMAVGTVEQEVVKSAQQDEKVAEHLKGKNIVKTITVPDRLVNFVIK